MTTQAGNTVTSWYNVRDMAAIDKVQAAFRRSRETLAPELQRRRSAGSMADVDSFREFATDMIHWAIASGSPRRRRKGRGRPAPAALGSSSSRRARAAAHQIRQIFSAGLTSGASGPQWKAAANSGMLQDHAVDPVRPRRVRVGQGVEALVLVALVLADPLGEAHEEALVGGEAVALRQLLAPRRLFQASQARIRPPRSATSSPSVRRLLILMSSTTVYCAYCPAMQAARFSNSLASLSVHQSLRLPAASNCLPRRRSRGSARGRWCRRCCRSSARRRASGRRAAAAASAGKFMSFIDGL